MSCWPWSHKWTTWEVTAAGQMIARMDTLGLPIHNPVEMKQVIGYYELQRRTCQKCGKSQLRETAT